MKNKRSTGFHYLWCALLAFASVAFELLVVVVEGIFQIDIDNLTTTQNIVHWLITIVGWILLGFLVIHIGKRTIGFDIWERGSKMLPWQYFAIVLCFVINITTKYLDWGGFKVVLEWNARGPLLFVFQYLYYLAEGFLISLVIVFGQKACEKWFHNEKIPYGGIVLGLTWGLSHIFTKTSLAVGLLSAVGGFLFGTVYLLVNKDYRKALPIITLLFIL